MGCCCSDDSEDDKGYKTNRKCRDILFLLIFICFWAGMFIICGFAFDKGDANRLIYGTDSYGNACGSKTTVFNETFDLTSNKKLYYLNPLSLTSISSFKYAKTVCLPSCPNVTCDVTQGPCAGSTFVCPYYRFSSYSIFDNLPNTSWNSTNYYDSFGNMTITASTSTVSFLQTVYNLGTPWSTMVNTLGLGSSSSGVNISGKYYQLQSQFPGNGPCYAVSLASDEFLNRCYPQITSNITEKLVESVGDSAATVLGSDAAGSFIKRLMNGGFRWSQYVSDISKGIMIICVAGLGCGLLISVVWMMFMRYFAAVFAWMTLLAANLMTIGIALFCWVEAGYIGSHSLQDRINSNIPSDINPAHLSTRTWLWISIGASIVALIVLIFTLLAISRLRVAIACIKVAAQSIRAMPSLLFFPILPYIFTCGLVIYWIAVSGMLYTAGTLTAHCSSAAKLSSVSFSELANVSNIDLRSLASSSSSVSTSYKCYTNMTDSEMAYECGRDPACRLNYDWDRKMMYVFIYHFFGLLWTNQVIVGFSCVVIAGSVGSHYWAGGDSSRMPFFPVLTALKNAFIFHLGSVILGAFFIAIFQFIRYVLEYIDQKSRRLQNASGIARAIMCLFKCILWCIEKIVSFINRNAYIIIGVRGSNYCFAVCTAIKLIVTNAMRIATVNIVGDTILFIGKVAVAASCGFVAFCLSEVKYYHDPINYPSTELSSPIMPIALSVIAGYFSAEVFFSVFEMAIDTVMLCFCEDCDLHDGDPKYAPPLLMEAVGLKPSAAAHNDGSATKAKGM